MSLTLQSMVRRIVCFVFARSGRAILDMAECYGCVKEYSTLPMLSRNYGWQLRQTSASMHLIEEKIKVPVTAVVAVVVTVLTVLSVGVVGIDGVDCDSVVKVVGVLALSKTNAQYHLHYSQRCAVSSVLSSHVVEEPSLIWLNVMGV